MGARRVRASKKMTAKRSKKVVDQEDAFARAFLGRGKTLYDPGDRRLVFHALCAYCGAEMWAPEGNLWAECPMCGGI